MNTLLGRVFALAALTAVLAQSPRATLEIQPNSPIITKAVGLSLALTCKANVQDLKLITQLEWRDQKNRRIENNRDSPFIVQKIASEAGVILIFTKLTADLAGLYHCTAKYANTESLEATIKVETIVDITWIDAPDNQYPILGKDYRIRCEVAANPPPEVDWIRNNVPIVSNDRYVVDNKGLLIKNIRESDDGVYTCRAVVVYTGNIKEKNIRVEVHVPPKLHNMKEISIIEGEPTSVQCNGTGKPPPQYTWIKENTREDLSVTDRFDVKKNTGLLIINRAEYDDNSVYKCVAENPAGRAETTVKINVLVKPRIYEFINVTTRTNTDTKIMCKATGVPTPMIVFRKRSSKDAFTLGSQKSDSRITTEYKAIDSREVVGTLNIYGVNRSDDGLYECIAENKVGNAYKNGHITVQFPPTFEKTKNYPPVWTWGNRPANLSCIAESIPNATIKWKYNGIEMEDNKPVWYISGRGPQSNLIIQPNNEKRLFAKYECIAFNELGEANRFIELRQATVPGNIQQVTRADLTATTVKFNIVGPPNLHGLPLRAFIVQYQTERERSWDTAHNKTWSIDAPYIVENLMPQETYNFRIAAKNEVGMGPFGGNQQITMPRRSVPAEPKILVSNLFENTTSDFVANSPYADHFEVRWSVPNDNGDPIDSYILNYCVTQRINGEWRDSETECSSEIHQSVEYTSYELNNLNADTTYTIKLKAHNAIGSSLPAQMRVKTARGVDSMIINHEGTSISSAMIIGIVVGVVLLILILVDVTCFCVSRAGIIALLCSRSKPVDDEDPKLGSLYSWRFPLPYCSYKAAPAHPSSLNLPLPVKLAPSPLDEKEPLSPENRDRTPSANGEKRNIAVEFDGKQVYSKPITEIGRHSAV